MSNITNDQREAIRERLAEIEKQNNGRLTPEAVVEDAKRKDSPLHAHFEWDVKKAAMRYWIERAREIITSVQVVTRIEKTRVASVYYVRDPSASTTEQGYVSIDRLRTDDDMAREAVVNEFARAAACLHRAKTLARVLNMEREVEQLIEGVESVKRIAEQPSAVTS